MQRLRLLFAARDAHLDAGRVCGLRKGRPQEPVGPQRRAAVAGAAFARVLRHVVGLPVGAGAGFQGQPLRGRRHRRQALSAFRRTARARCWPTWTPSKSTPSRWIRKDRVYAATSPDGKIYRITGNGKPEVFYDPKAEVHLGRWRSTARATCWWRTGDQGEIHRVTPDGKGKVLFQDRRDARPFDGGGCERQPDCRDRPERPGAARFARGRGLRAVPDAQEGSDRGGRGARRSRSTRPAVGNKQPASRRRPQPGPPPPPAR